MILSISRIKEENFIIISIDAGQTFEKIKCLIYDKISQQLGVERTSSIRQRATNLQLTPSVIVNIECFHTKSWSMLRIPRLILLFIFVMQILNNVIMHTKETKECTIVSKKVKLSIFANECLLMQEIPKTLQNNQK